MGFGAEGDGDASVPKESTEEDNYMELYVEKELKSKFEPLEESMNQRIEEIEKLVERLNSMDD